MQHCFNLLSPGAAAAAAAAFKVLCPRVSTALHFRYRSDTTIKAHNRTPGCGYYGRFQWSGELSHVQLCSKSCSSVTISRVFDRRFANKCTAHICIYAHTTKCQCALFCNLSSIQVIMHIILYPQSRLMRL